MKQQSSQIDSLLFIQLSSIANTSNLKLSSSSLSLFLRRSKQVCNNRIPIATKTFSLDQDRCSIKEVALAMCQRQDFLQIQFIEEASKVSAYLKLPLDKLLDIPKVKHDIECLLVEKNWDRFFQGPLRNIVQVDLSVISFSQIAGRLIISEVAVDLGAECSYLQVQWHGQARSVKNKTASQRNWRWNEGIHFEANDLNKVLTLVVSAFNKENQVVGKQEVDVVASQMLLPQENPTEIELLLQNNGNNVGKVELHYQFLFNNS